jgi:hypothetical protein
VTNIVDYTADLPTREVLLDLRFHRQSRMFIEDEGGKFEHFFFVNSAIETLCKDWFYV